jgi:hypothetical protein
MPEVTGILFFGSVQRGETTPTSDLDLYMVVEQEQTWSARRKSHGIEVEVYFAPAHEWRRNLKDRHVIVVKAFATGSILLDRKGEVARLASLGRMIWSEGPSQLEPLQVANWRIRLSDAIRDLEGLPPGSAEACLLTGMLLPLALEAYCGLHRLWPEKPGKLLARVADHDPGLGRRMIQFYQSDGLPAQQAITLVDCVLEPFGGRLLEYEGPRVPCEAAT